MTPREAARSAAVFGYVVVGDDSTGYGVERDGEAFIPPHRKRTLAHMARCAWFWASKRAWSD